ncbi:DUF3793 family protein [Atopobium deltae]|uniref:Uncharacterized protein n=1 Tax=Atopobium deltae TaxID=1393034 RepID=A0A133XQD5_9ACTN|nr:hypothetical protein HMPREF3192_01254 [Atopobium deltae]
MRECRRRLVRYYLQKENAQRSRNAQRLRSCEFPSHYEFPHEMGLLFGYPLEDVLGFIHKYLQTCCGPWCAYGDVHLRVCALRRLKLPRNTI